MKSIDIVAIGSCYVDINAGGFPFDENGIPAQTELVGGNYEVVPGGSAVNFCRLLQQLAQQTAFIGMTGDDNFGEILEKLLQDQGVQPHLTRQPGLTTNIGFNLTGPNESHVMLVAGTANAALAPEFVLPKLREVIEDTSMLYLGGCFKLKTFQAAFKDVAELARKHGATLVVDHGRIPHGTDDVMRQAVKEVVLQADYYLPSKQEMLELWEVATIEEGLRILRKRSPQLTVVIKDGARGAWFLHEESVQQVQAEPIEDPTILSGAGDSFNAGLIAALRADCKLTAAATFANTVAAAHISGRGLPSLER